MGLGLEFGLSSIGDAGLLVYGVWLLVVWFGCLFEGVCG